MKVLLVSFYNTEAYGVRSLHASAFREGHEIAMLFFKTETHMYEKALVKGLKGKINSVTETEIELFASFLKEWNPDIVAFSLVSSHFHLFETLSKRVRSIGKTVIVGGWEASLNPERCLQLADYVCIGEGEEAFCELLRKLKEGTDTSGVSNFWINSKSRIVRNPVRPLNQNLSDLPIPILNNQMVCLIENDKLVYKEPYFQNDRYGTFVGIGCPYRCTYCSNSFMASQVYPKQWSKPRFHNMERMQCELSYVKRKLPNVKVIDFYDEVFSPSVEWSRDFFAWYKGSIGIPFCCTFFPGRCSDDLCKVLAEGGMSRVWLGVQSGSEDVRRKVFQRYYDNDTVLKQVRIFHKYHVNVRYDFIFDNPFETFDDSLQSLRLILRFPQPFSVNQFSLKFFPNTEISTMALAAGYIQESDLTDHSDNWQDNYNIAMDAPTPERTFIHRSVSLISFLAKGGNLNPEDMERMFQRFQSSGNLEEVTTRLNEFVKVE